MNPVIKRLYILNSIVALVSIAVLFGWIFEIQALRSIYSEWVSMKFITALFFFAIGVILFLLLEFERGNKKVVNTTAIICLFLFLYAIFILINDFLGLNLFFWDYLTGEKYIQGIDTLPGRPSIVTILGFTFVTYVIFLRVRGIAGVRDYYWVGLILVSLGVVALLGYLFSYPILFFAIPGFSTGAAAHTAGLFIIIGKYLMVLAKAVLQKTL